MHRGSWVLVAGLLLTGSACARRGGGAPQPADSPVHVEVTNQYGLPMEVYAVGAGTSHRLGIVDPGMVGRFVVPQTLIGNGLVEFQAHPSVSTQLVRSGELQLAPGAFVDFVITAQLFNSRATVRR
jgi:hypothetical protein